MIYDLEGSNSAAITCVPVTAQPRVRSPVRAGEVCTWRFNSLPSTLDTVYLSWLARPHKSRFICCLTGTEWERKEVLRTTSSLAVTTLAVPTSKLYTPCTCTASWQGDYVGCNFGLRFVGYGSRLPRCGAVLGQDTSPACALSSLRSEWVPAWTMIACVFE